MIRFFYLPDKCYFDTNNSYMKYPVNQLYLKDNLIGYIFALYRRCITPFHMASANKFSMKHCKPVI